MFDVKLVLEGGRERLGILLQRFGLSGNCPRSVESESTKMGGSWGANEDAK